MRVWEWEPGYQTWSISNWHGGMWVENNITWFDWRCQVGERKNDVAKYSVLVIAWLEWVINTYSSGSLLSDMDFIFGTGCQGFSGYLKVFEAHDCDDSFRLMSIFGKAYWRVRGFLRSWTSSSSSSAINLLKRKVEARISQNCCGWLTWRPTSFPGIIGIQVCSFLRGCKGENPHRIPSSAISECYGFNLFNCISSVISR